MTKLDNYKQALLVKKGKTCMNNEIKKIVSFLTETEIKYIIRKMEWDSFYKEVCEKIRNK